MLRLFYLMFIILLKYFLFLWNSSLHILNDEISKKRYFKMKWIYWKKSLFHWTNILDNYRTNPSWYSSYWSQSKHRISIFSLRGIFKHDILSTMKYVFLHWETTRIIRWDFSMFFQCSHLFVFTVFATINGISCSLELNGNVPPHPNHTQTIHSWVILSEISSRLSTNLLKLSQFFADLNLR